MEQKDADIILEAIPRIRSRIEPISGFGINDSTFSVSKSIDGRRFNHSAYQAWQGMIKRCYDPKFHARNETYIGCEVCEEWQRFSNFFAWWKLNHVYGYELDKDLLIPGNKVYSPLTCLYIPKSLNLFTGNSQRIRGKYPIGASFHKSTGKFIGSIRCGDRKYLYLGLFDSPHEAHLAWLSKKIHLAEAYKDICDSIHPHLFRGLISKITLMRCSDVQNDIA